MLALHSPATAWGARPWAARRLAAAALLAVIFLVGGPTGAAVAESRLVVAHEVPVVELDPVAGYVNAPSPYEVGLALYDNLVTFDENLGIVPSLATRWAVGPDGRTWTFRLRDGVKFHDGTDFDAEAAKFSLDRSIDRQLNPLNRPLWDPLESVRVIDRHTIEIVTRHPFPTLLNTLAHGSAAMLSPAAARRLGKELERNPVGSGPFRLVRFEPGSTVVLERFAGYWGPAPGVQEITFRYVPDSSARVGLLLAGQADVITAVTPQDAVRLSTTPGVTLLSRPTLRTVGIGMSFLNPALQDPAVRLALNHAVDKAGIVRAIFLNQAEVLDSPVAPHATGHFPVGPHPYDPQRARELLAGAGWVRGPSGVLEKQGKPLSLTLITAEGAYPNDIQVVQAVANQLRAVGVDVRVLKVDRAGYWDYLKVPAKDVKFDLFIWAFNPSNGDGGYTLASLFKSNPDDQGVPQVWNIGRYRSAWVDELLAEADRTIDPQARASVLAEAQRALMEDNPYIWLYAERRITAMRGDVRGVVLLPTLFTNLRAATR